MIKIKFNNIINSKINNNENILGQFFYQNIFFKIRNKYSKLIALISKYVCKMSFCI